MAGWLLGPVLGSRTRVERIEALVVAVFGAFIAGDFLAAMLGRPVTSADAFSPFSLVLAIAGAVGMMVLLKIMRRAVGPLRPGRSPGDRRR